VGDLYLVLLCTQGKSHSVNCAGNVYLCTQLVSGGHTVLISDKSFVSQGVGSSVSVHISAFRQKRKELCLSLYQVNKGVFACLTEVRRKVT
jgi:hypothetical protein